jgi:transcriptional regulator with XRE-family HTH domain
MWTRHRSEPEERQRDFDREMLRSMFASMFWAAIEERRRAGKFTLQQLAEKLGVGKSVVSRWFSSQGPNWQIDTISDIAGALDLDLRIEAVDRTTGKIFGATWPCTQAGTRADAEGARAERTMAVARS